MRPQRCAGNVQKNPHAQRKKDKVTFYSPSVVRSSPTPSSTKPEEREFVADSGASMHMLSRKDMNSAELDTVRVSRNSATVTTATGGSANKRGSNSVRQLFRIIRDSTDPRGYASSSIAWKALRTSGQIRHLIYKRRKYTMQHGELRAHRCSGIVNGTSHLVSRGHARSPFAWKTLRKTTDIPVSGPVAKNRTSLKKRQGNTMQHGIRCTDRCPWIVNRLFKFDNKYISNIVKTGFNGRLYVKSSDHTTSKYTQSSSGRPGAQFRKIRG